jgi:hypothetical protein
MRNSNISGSTFQYIVINEIRSIDPNSYPDEIEGDYEEGNDDVVQDTVTSGN